MKSFISIAIWVCGVSLTILLFFVELFLSIALFAFDRKRKVVHAQCFWWADAVIKLNPHWRLKVSGLDNIDREKAYVIVANHQSLADIIVLYKTRMQFKWIAKESLFKVPFVGWCLSLTKHIKLSRGKLGSIKRVYRDASDWLKKDISVLFFPEGSRSDTDKLNEFQNGAFKLAIKEKKPILPISIRGTRGVIAKGGWLFKTDALCKLTVLQPIDTTGLQSGDFASLRDAVHAKLANVMA